MKKNLLFFAAAAAVAFFLRGTISAWPVFSTIYNFTSGAASTSSTSSTSGN
jgi:hypothetical protein